MVLSKDVEVAEGTVQRNGFNDTLMILFRRNRRFYFEMLIPAVHREEFVTFL